MPKQQPFGNDRNRHCNHCGQGGHRTATRPTPRTIILATDRRRSLTLSRARQTRHLLLITILRSCNIETRLGTVPSFSFVRSRCHRLCRLTLGCFARRSRCRLTDFLSCISSPTLGTALARLSKLSTRTTLSPRTVSSYLHVVVRGAPLARGVTRIGLSLRRTGTQDGRRLVARLAMRLVRLCNRGRQLGARRADWW